MSASFQQPSPFESLSSPDPAVVIATIHACASHLSSFDLQDLDASEYADALVPLRRHSDARVRQALAEIATLLPSPFADDLIEWLAADSDHYVQRAAHRSAQKRAASRRARAKREAERERVVSLYEQLEQRHGAGARRLAERAAREENSVWIRRLDHESSKVLLAIDTSLALGAAAATDAGDAASCRAHVADARERLRYLAMLLSAARASAVAPPLSYERSALLPVVEEARDQLLSRLGAAAGGVLFVISVPGDLVFDFDRRALLQVFQNLLQNGVEAHEAGAKVRLCVSARVEQAGTAVVVAVSDEGRGMNEEQKATLFTPFLTSKPGGTGVGLSVVRREVEEGHGGTIAVDSHLGVGTTVTLTLPVHRAKGEGPPAHPVGRTARGRRPKGGT